MAYTRSKLLKNHMSNMLLFVCYLICLQILNVWAEPIIEFNSLVNSLNAFNDYKFKLMDNSLTDDVTRLYTITNTLVFDTNEPKLIDQNCLTNYNGSYSIDLNSKTKSIRLKLQNKHNEDTKPYENVLLSVFKNGSIQTNDNTNNIRYKHTKHEMINSNGNSCTNNDADQFRYPKTENNLEKCYSTLDYRYENDDPSKYNKFYGTHNRNFLSMNLVPNKDQTCIAITYIHKLKSKMDIEMELLDNAQFVIAEAELVKSEEIKTMKITNIGLTKDNSYELVITLKITDNNRHIDYDGTIFGLIRIAYCSTTQDDDVQLGEKSNSNIESKPFRIFGYGIEDSTKNNSTIEKSKKLCFNGGHEIKNSKCVCPPGFMGEFCETGCGKNLYGGNCSNICSILKKKECRGILMCTNYGCTCPAGLTGPKCNEDCVPGKYGANCTQLCSPNCFQSKCDQYTGVCLQGCSKEYIPPYCQNKYPYLIKAPTQISEEYESIKLQLNFQSDNIKGGDESLKIKYYQLLYKPSNEKTFYKSEVKVFNENNTSVTENLEDLIPDTKYEVGVMILTNYGNVNDQDIVYGEYRTSCKQPQVHDYNMKSIQKNKYIKITWDKIGVEKLECKIQQYVLTLSFNQSEYEISSAQEIISSSNNEYIIKYKDLYPGYQYSITITPETSKGPLQQSSALLFNPLIIDQEIKVKDIVTTFENNTIKVSWKLQSLFSYDTPVRKPITSVIKYKLNRILSCSKESIKESEWTEKKINNETNYEIIDAFPNSQYCIQVNIMDDNFDYENNTIQQENMVYLYTQSAYPKIEPKISNLDEQVETTGNSIKVQLDDASINCTKLNGFYSNYYIELKEMTASSKLQIKETKKNDIFFDNLKPNTLYEMKVFIKTHVGYSPDHYLLLNLTTNSLEPINDLMVYKKNIQNNTVGLRWRYSENKNLLGFGVESNENLTEVSSIKPMKCSAWPEYYCFTFTDFNFKKTPNKNYTLKIKPKDNFRRAGYVSINFDADDKLAPEPPKNLEAKFIGNDTMNLQWDIPWKLNIGLKRFIITVDDNIEDETILKAKIQVIEEKPTYNYTVNKLKPESEYTIAVMAQYQKSLQSTPTILIITTLSNDEQMHQIKNNRQINAAAAAPPPPPPPPPQPLTPTPPQQPQINAAAAETITTTTTNATATNTNTTATNTNTNTTATTV